MSRTLDQLVSDAVQAAVTSEAISLAVQVAAEKAVSSAIDDAFGYKSKFRQSVKAAIDAVLPMADATDLATFASTLRGVLQQRLAAVVPDTVMEHLGPVFDAMLAEPSVISLAELREAYVSKLQDDLRAGACCGDEQEADPEYTWTLDAPKAGACSRYWDLTVAPDADAGKYYSDNSMTLRFRQLDGTPELSECWHVNVGNAARHVSSLFAGPLFGFDAMVFRLIGRLAKLKHAF